MTTITTFHTMLEQIGRMNVLAISGGRVHYGTDLEHPTIILPVRYGYAVEVTYEPGQDLYTVRRTFTRGLKRWTKRTWERVYNDQLGEIAYTASCYLDN